MLNENVLHLASLVRVGTEVTVVRSLDGKIASATSSKPSAIKAASRQRPQRYERRDFQGRGDDYDDPYYYEPWR